MNIQTMTRQQAQNLDEKTSVIGCANTPIGCIALTMINGCLTHIELNTNKNTLEPWAQKIMDSFFIRHTLPCPLLLIGTTFQTTVWKTLATQVPWGQTITYGELAQKCGHPKASRAIGTAMNKNPIPILIPCHRVIASNHQAGGYGGGLDIKKHLLENEGVFNIHYP